MAATRILLAVRPYFPGTAQKTARLKGLIPSGAMIYNEQFNLVTSGLVLEIDFRVAIAIALTVAM